MSDTPTQRLDVWLYRTRLCKTRGDAAKLIRKGRLRLGRDDVTRRVKKPHFALRPGDALTLMRGSTLIDVTVTALPARRGPSAEARACYDWQGNRTPS